MTELTTPQIRMYLIKLAEMKRRPYYELCVIQQVIQAFKDKKEHQLKTEILSIIESVKLKALVRKYCGEKQ